MRKVLLFLAIPVLFFLSCAKEKSYEQGINDDLAYETSWQFKDSSVLFNGSATTYELDGTGTEMEYVGGTKDGLGTFEMRLISAAKLKQGTYQSGKGEVEFSYMSGGMPRFAADIDSVGENLTVTILSIDSVSVVGFFTGTARNGAGVVVPVTEGKFNYRKAVAADTASVGTLGTAADTCTGAAIAGTYFKAVPLGATNTVTVNVNITKVGTYSIATDTVNGIYFSKTGSFTTLGAQTVVLTGSGTPIDSVTTSLTVKYGTSKCKFGIEVGAAATSEGTLGATANACTGVVFAGVYTKNTALVAANTITIEVNITKAGFYSITTDTVSGFYFNKTGVFSATGPQTIVLNGFGTPTDTGSVAFKVNYNTSSCNFTAKVAAETVTPPLGDEYFQFTTGSTIVNAVPDGATITSFAGITALNLMASTSGDSTFILGATALGDLKTGVVYSTSSLMPPAGAFTGADDNSITIYTADPSVTGVSISIKFDVIDLTGKVISGTFSGTAKDAGGVTKTITAGKFKANLL